MVIANACGHPDCATERQRLDVLVQANNALIGQVEGWKLDYAALEAKCEFWQRLANERSVEIIRLMDELARRGR